MENKCKLAAVILAAGYSSRMGDLKPLLKFGDKTALEILTETFMQGNIDDIIVVVGFNADKIIESSKNLDVKWVINPDYDSGMYSSIKEAVKAMDKDTEGFFLIPVDVPVINKHTVESLKMEFEKGEKGIIYPTFDGAKGHPPIISAKYKYIILNDFAPGGLRNLLNKYAGDAVEVPVYDYGTQLDMDTPSDYIKLVQYFESKSIPNDEECDAILKKYKVPSNVILHSKAVAYEACSIVERLLKNGYYVNLKKIRAAALLHDIGRKEKNHAKAGERILKELGYDEIAEIISAHMDIEVKSDDNLTEKEIVYLADKMVMNDEIIPLKQRFNEYLDRFDDNPEALNKIRIRFKNAKLIENKIKKITEGTF